MMDRYAKAVLTVIALALITLVVQRLFQPALAQAQMCTVQQPCVVVNYYWEEVTHEYKPCFDRQRASFAVSTK